MKRNLLLVLISMSFLTTNAQWVNIPDSNFGKWLTTTYPTCMQGNPQTGFQMDTACSSILLDTIVDCRQKSISNLTGITYFKSLKSLICLSNWITFIPSLPTSLAYFDCNGNYLTSLPDLPGSLRELHCNYNSLTTLPNLPSSLVKLDCYWNKLTSIPALPVGLVFFKCNDNELTVLPSLPNTLTTLICSNNQLSAIPTIPSSLELLEASTNQIATLPNLPTSLLQLGCAENQLTSLPTLPNSLNYLACGTNLISVLPPLPAHLYFLDCSVNQLSSVPTLPDSLEMLSFAGNPNILCCPRLNIVRELDIFNTGITCLPNYPRKNIYINSDLSPLPLCDLSSGCPIDFNIAGNVHKDTAITCLQDSLYPGNKTSNLKIILSKAGVIKDQIFVNSSGEYFFDTDSFSNYEVSIDTFDYPIHVKCPTSAMHQVAITALDSIKDEVNFGIECAGTDIGVSSILANFRPGRNSNVLIRAGDIYSLGCNGNSAATVTTKLVGDVHYISPALGALTPTSVSGNTLTYAIADASTINTERDFNIVVSTDSNATFGSSVCVTTSIHTTIPDYSFLNDSLTMCFVVSNSYDPNAKTVYPKDITPNASWLNYTVQFQNTGNDTAYDIVVRDTLSGNVDLESFQFLASSHSAVVQVKGNVAIFTFANINLLDSLHNEPKSHGWLQYRIKTKPGLPLQSQIKNTAYIYFDLNAPVATNTAVTSVNVTGIHEIKTLEPTLSLYPNPASNVLHIGTNSTHPQWLTFFDASGRKVNEQAYTNTVDVSALANGVYLVELKSEEGTVRKRFVR